MGCKQFIINLKSVFILLGFVPLFVTGQNYPRFELYQLKQGTDSGQFIVTGLDSNLAFNNILRFRSADSTLLIGLDTVAVKSDIISSSFIFDAGLGIEIEQDGDTYLFESLSIEDSIKNQTGTLIEEGTPLYATGVQGNYWTVAPADASDPSKMPVVVIAGEDIAAGGTGLGLIKGHIKQVNTTGLADGAEVYVASGGGYTSTKPTAEGVIIQRLGTVIKGNSANGSGIINLGDEAYWNDYVDRVELGDSLALFLKTEVDGSVTNELQTISTSGAAGNISLSNGGGTLNLNVNDADASTTNEIQTLSYNPSTDVISISGGNSIDITEVNQNQNITLSGDATGSGTTAITVTVIDDSHNHIIGNVDGLQTALNSKLETEVDGSVTNEGSLTVGAGTSTTSLINSNTSGSTPVTLTAGTNITLSETGNNITIAASGGGSSLWSEGATAGEIYYNSGNVGIGLTDPEYPLHVSGRGYFTDDLRAYDRIYLGGDFNHTSGSYAPYIDRYAASGETGMDFYSYNSGANFPLFRFFDSYNSYSEVFRLNSNASTYQIIGTGDSDFNGDFNLDGRLDVNGLADFNSDQNASHDFGVGSSNYYPFMWVDASADKMAVGGGTPQYTLDVTGDINFTGTLYEDGSPFSAGGVTINNNTNNYLLTATGTANTINGESGLTWDGDTLKINGLINQTTATFGSTYFGTNSGVNNVSGSNNTGFGNGSGQNISTGSQNTAVGLGALYSVTTASSNVGIGYAASGFVTSNNPSQSVFIGALTTPGGSNQSNEIVIGYSATGQGSNSIMLGNSSITDLYCYDTSISSPSDKRDKKKIKSLKSGLDFVRELRPVIFEWNMREGTKKGIKDIGFVAQELNNAEKNTDEFEFINLTKHDKKLDRWFAQYSNLIPVYAKAIQDLDDKVNQQQIIIESQDKRIRQLEEMVKQLMEKK